MGYLGLTPIGAPRINPRYREDRPAENLPLISGVVANLSGAGLRVWGELPKSPLAKINYLGKRLSCQRVMNDLKISFVNNLVLAPPEKK